MALGQDRLDTGTAGRVQPVCWAVRQAERPGMDERIWDRLSRGAGENLPVPARSPEEDWPRAGWQGGPGWASATAYG